jgi:hypothetical protein
MIVRALRGVMIAGLIALAGSANAQQPSEGPWDKFSIAIGGYASTLDSELQVNSETLGVGAVIDLKNTLGVESKYTTGRLDTIYRYGKSRRHQIEFHYFESNRSGDRTLTEDIQIGDKLFKAGENLHTDFDLKFANVDYAYAFLQDERVRLAVSGGLHITGVGLKIESAGLSVSEDESFTAPLPVVGLRLEVALAKNWKFKSGFDVFYLEYDNFTGGLADSYVGVEWNPFQHFGFGLGINSIAYRIEGDGHDPNGMDFNGKLSFNLSGLMLYGKYFF